MEQGFDQGAACTFSVYRECNGKRTPNLGEKAIFIGKFKKIAPGNGNEFWKLEFREEGEGCEDNILLDFWLPWPNCYSFSSNKLPERVIAGDAHIF